MLFQLVDALALLPPLLLRFEILKLASVAHSTPRWVLCP